MARQALVTGACGFIGRYVARRFAQGGFRVSGMGHGDLSPAEQSMWGIAEWHPCEIDLASMQKFGGTPDVIVHCAGSGSVGFSLANPEEDRRRTVDTTEAVLEFICRHSQSTRLVYPSSAGTYGIARQFPIREDEPLQPITPYGKNKVAVEALCHEYGGGGVKTAIVRLFSIYGPGLRKQLLWDACKKLSRGDRNFSGTGEETRDWLHASDAAELLFVAAQNATGECTIVNGASGVEVSVHEMLGELSNALGLLEPISFSGEGRPGDPVRYFADISLARAWNWQPKIHWREGVKSYAEWFRNSLTKE